MGGGATHNKTAARGGFNETSALPHLMREDGGHRLIMEGGAREQKLGMGGLGISEFAADGSAAMWGVCCVRWKIGVSCGGGARRGVNLPWA